MSDENQVRVDIVSDEASLKAATREARSDLDQLQKSATGADKALHDAAGGADKLKDGLSGAKGAIVATTAEVTGLSEGAVAAVATLGAVAVGVSAIAVTMFTAYRDGKREVEAMNLAIERSNGYVGASRDQMRALAGEMATHSQLTIDQAKDIATALAASGRIGAGAFEKVGRMAGDFARVMGTDVAKVGPELIKLFDDPAQGAERLNRQMHFLSAAELDHIEHLVRMGEVTQAQTLLADKLGTRLGEIAPKLGILERGWNGVQGAASKAWDAMMGIGREQTTKQRLDAVYDRIIEVQAMGAGARNLPTGKQLPALRQEVLKLQEQLAAETQKVWEKSQAAEQNRNEQDSRDLVKRYSISARAADIDADILRLEKLRLTATGDMAQQYDEAIKKLRENRTKLFTEKIAAKTDLQKMIELGQKNELDAYYETGGEETMRIVAAKRAVASASKEKAAAEKEAAEAVKLHTDYLKAQIAPLEQHTLKLEEEVATYGMTASQIEAVNLQRLEEARNIAAENGAFPEHLAYLDQEIDLRRRLVAAAGSKEALDANKKATEEMRRDWQRMHEQLSQSLTDELMKGGQDAGELLENYFKTLVLRPIISGVVNAGMNAGASLLGINGSSGGADGLGSLLSNGSSLYNAATGGGIFGSVGGFGAGAASAASELALGASFVGPSASLASGAVGAGATAGLASGSAGAASGLAGLSAAAPWIAGGLAIASIFGGSLFGSKKPAPIEWGLVDLPRGPNPQQYYGSQPALSPWAQYMEHGPFGTLLTTGQHLSRNGMSAGALQSQVTHPLIELDKVLGGYLSEKEKNKISMALYNGREGEHGWSQAEVEGVMMRRLERISNAIGGWTDTLFDKTTGDLQSRYTKLAQILAIHADPELDKLAKATGSKGGLTSIKALQDLIAAATKSAQDLLGSMSLTLAALDSVTEFRGGLMSAMSTIRGDTETPESRINWLRSRLDEETDLGRQLDLAGQIKDLVLERYTSEREMIEQNRAAALEAAGVLRDFSKGLLVSDLSPLTNAQRLSEAGSQYQSLLGRVQGGDVAAAGQLTSAASTYLGEARGYYASGSQYSAIFDSVQTMLNQVASSSESSMNWQEQLLTIDQEALSGLGDLTSLTEDWTLNLENLLVDQTREFEKIGFSLETVATNTKDLDARIAVLIDAALGERFEKLSAVVEKSAQTTARAMTNAVQTAVRA